MTSIPISLANERLADRYLWFTSVNFVGLALIGRGFAYIVPAPFFISEVTMLVGLYVLLRAGNIRALFTLPHTFILVALAAWGTYRTLPYIPIYQIDAVRDAFLFGYMGWAFILAGLIIAKPERLNTVIKWFAWFTKIFLIGAPLAFVLSKFFGRQLPGWPWAYAVPVISLKGGDVCVTLAGIMAFWVAGFISRVSIFYMASLLSLLCLTGSFNRGGLLAFMAAMGLCVVCKPRSPWPWRVLGTLAFGAALLYVTQVEIQIPGRQRSISFDQFVENFSSVVGDSNRPDLEGTKAWRKGWWEEIIRYSVHGRYKWTGKGFGINLADDDGFQVGAMTNMLRSPHNGHLNILARTGLPGMGMWVAAHGLWGLSMAYFFIVSLYRRDGQWSNVFLWLSAFYIAININASVDVYLEGPMGGMPLWTVYGMGLASMYLYQHNRGILRHPDDPAPGDGPTYGFEVVPPSVPTGRRPELATSVDQSGLSAQLAGFDRVTRN